MKNVKKIVFYDGDCGFCNQTVQFILNHEKDHSIYFSAIQSSFSSAFFHSNNLPTPDLSTFYFFDGNQLHDKSSAAFRVLKHLKWYWQILRIFQFLPIQLRDFVYDFIAKRRHRIAGRYCVMVDETNLARFLKE